MFYHDTYSSMTSEMSAVTAAMAHMTEEHKEILNLVCVKGMKYEHVSNLLHISVDAVCARLFAAREHLTLLMQMPKIPEAAVIMEMRRTSIAH